MLGRLLAGVAILQLIGQSTVAAEDGRAINGRGVDFSTQRPLVGRTVAVGALRAVTDAEGRFSLAGVPPTYDVILVEPDRTTVTVYRRLQRRDPLLTANLHRENRWKPQHYATVRGTLAGGGPYPTAYPDYATVYLFSEQQSMDRPLLPPEPLGPDFRPLSVGWDGVLSVKGLLVALRRVPEVPPVARKKGEHETKAKPAFSTWIGHRELALTYRETTVSPRPRGPVLRAGRLPFVRFVDGPVRDPARREAGRAESGTATAPQSSRRDRCAGNVIFVVRRSLGGLPAGDRRAIPDAHEPQHLHLHDRDLDQVAGSRACRHPLPDRRRFLCLPRARARALRRSGRGGWPRRPRGDDSEGDAPERVAVLLVHRRAVGAGCGDDETGGECRRIVRRPLRVGHRLQSVDERRRPRDVRAVGDQHEVETLSAIRGGDRDSSPRPTRDTGPTTPASTPTNRGSRRCDATPVHEGRSISPGGRDS